MSFTARCTQSSRNSRGELYTGMHFAHAQLQIYCWKSQCVPLEDLKPVPQTCLHFAEAHYFCSLLSWLLISSSTAKPSLYYLTLHWTQIQSAGRKLLKINPFYCHLSLLALILILFCDFLVEIANILSSHGLEIHILHSWYFKSSICFDERQDIW